MAKEMEQAVWSRRQQRDNRPDYTPKGPPVRFAMKSLYGGTCRACRQRIDVGTIILWSRALGARHKECPVRKDAAPGLRDVGTGPVVYNYHAQRWEKR